MKHKKLKFKRGSLLFLFLSFAVVFIIVKPNLKKSIQKEKIDYVSLVSSYQLKDIDKDFLSWIKSNYNEDVLKKLNESYLLGNYDNDLWHNLTGNSYTVLKDLYNNKYKNKNNVTVIEGKKDSINIGFVGDVSLADNWAIMPKYKEKNKKVLGILSEKMIKNLTKADWMIANSEFAFSTRGTAMKNKTYTFRADPKNVTVYNEMGVDMVTLANNHVYDYGKEAFLDTLSTLNDNNIPYIGAGKNKDEAEEAHYLIINGYKISFLSATRAEKYILTPEALENREGVFRCYDTSRLKKRIEEEKQKSDFVVAIIHFGKEGSHTLEDVQRKSARLYIDSGADLVVGHHAHVLQGMEFYRGKLIAYNLGNFIFNSLTVDTGILNWNLNNEGISKFSFIPGIQKNCYTDVLEGVKAREVYDKLEKWSTNIKIDDNGYIVEK